MAIDLGKMRCLMFEQGGSSISMPLLAMLVFWLAIIFSSFGLFAPRNATVMITLFLCALSVAAAISSILEVYAAFQGLIQISRAPLRSGLAHLRQIADRSVRTLSSALLARISFGFVRFVGAEPGSCWYCSAGSPGYCSYFVGLRYERLATTFYQTKTAPRSLHLRGNIRHHHRVAATANGFRLNHEE